MKTIHMIAFVLLVVGGLNWGLVGLFNFDLVGSILGVGSGITQLVYVLVGISALYIGFTHKGDCKVCGGAK